MTSDNAMALSMLFNNNCEGYKKVIHLGLKF